MPTRLNNSAASSMARREGVRSRQPKGLLPSNVRNGSRVDSVAEWERRMKQLNPFWQPSRYTVIDYEYD